MQKKIKLSIIIGASLLVWFVFFPNNEEPTPAITYTIEHFNEDGCEIYREIADLAAKRSDYPKALEFYNKSLEYKPDNLTTYDRMGITHEQSNNLNAALKTYFKALSISSNFKEERFRKDIEIKQEFNANLGISLKDSTAWTGVQPLKDKTILVYTEKGLGDTLQFCRFLPQLVGRGAKVLFKPQNSLVALLKQSPLGVTIIDSSSNAQEYQNTHIDYYVSLLQLPYFLDICLQDCIAHKKYLTVQTQHIQNFKKLFTQNTFNIGITWQGDPTHINDKNRSLQLAHFYNLCRIPGIQVYSLQKFAGHEQLKNVPDDISIIDLDEHINDFADTAAIIENLDLVISVDTAIAHLAGALEKQVFLLTPYISDWRWLDHYAQEQQVWYKNVKKIKQDKPRSWLPVFNKLNKLVAVAKQDAMHELDCIKS
ncbi:MAG: hypothetical protein ABH827_05570 [bacterium]